MATIYRDAISGAADDVAVDPNQIDAAGTKPAEPGKRKRGRPPGSGKPIGEGTDGKSKAKQAPLDLSSLTGLFVGLHAMLAVQTKTPELAIDDGEGEQFMKAAQNVMRHYGVTATQKTLDTIAFFGVVAGMYGPRIAAIRFRKLSEREETNKRRTAPSQGFNGGIRLDPQPLHSGGFVNLDEQN